VGSGAPLWGAFAAGKHRSSAAAQHGDRHTGPRHVRLTFPTHRRIFRWWKEQRGTQEHHHRFQLYSLSVLLAIRVAYSIRDSGGGGNSRLGVHVYYRNRTIIAHKK